MSPIHCGLDFGTSNSTVAVAAASGAPRLLPLEDGRVTIPSAIFFGFEDDRRYFGRRAVAEYVSGADGRLMRSVKSILGTSLFADATRIKRRAVPFSEILGDFVGELKRRSEAALGAGITDVMVGRPVHFVDHDTDADLEARRQLESAVRAQGFRHVEFQFEPIAAALDYEQQVTGEELALVVDIGGGTSDFSIVRVSPERAKSADRQRDILANAGVHIGGTDFDRLLSMLATMPQLGFRTSTRDGKRPLPSGPYYDLATWHRINRLYTQKTLADLRSTRLEAAYPERVGQMIALIEQRLGHRLAARVEEAKITLTEVGSTALSFDARDVSLRAEISRADLSRALEEAIEKIAAAIKRAIEGAGVARSDIQTLILTGGSTQIPAIIARLKQLFPEAEFVSTDAFGSVGLGLALDARRKFGRVETPAPV
jgi:hypothetical chaperone protein